MTLTDEQIKRAKDKLIDELTCAIQCVIHDDWSTMLYRLRDSEVIRHQLDVGENYTL